MKNIHKFQVVQKIAKLRSITLNTNKRYTVQTNIGLQQGNVFACIRDADVYADDLDYTYSHRLKDLSTRFTSLLATTPWKLLNILSGFLVAVINSTTEEIKSVCC